MRATHQISAVFIEQCKLKVRYAKVNLQRRRAFVEDAIRQLRLAEGELKKWTAVRQKQRRARKA